MTLEVSRYRDVDREAVRAFLEARPEATFFHDPRWCDVVAAEFGHPTASLLAREGGEVVGWLPLGLVRSALTGRSLVSVPFGVYGGIVARDEGVTAALLAAAGDERERLGAARVELRHLVPPPGLPGDLPRQELYVTFLRGLPDDPDACLAMIPRKSRASARQARDRHGLEFVDAADGVEVLHRLFLLNKRRLGSPSFSRRWFERLRETFRDQVLVHAVRHRGHTIAAVMSFVHRDTLNPYYSGSLPGSERLGSMNFVYWKLMEEAVRRGLGRFDFGRSRAGSGAAAFKRNMGFEATPLDYRHLLAPGAAPPDVNPSNPKFDRVRALWSRLPVAVVRCLGPRLIRHLP